MITVICGNDTFSSRRKFQEVKSQKAHEIVEFEGAHDIEKIMLALKSESLFGNPLQVILELEKDLLPPDLENFIVTNQKNNNLLIWFGYNIPKKNDFVQKVREVGGVVYEFSAKKSSSNFDLVSALLSGNKDFAIKAFAMYQENKEKDDYVVGALAFEIRNALGVACNAQFVKSLKPFPYSKAQTYAKRFSKEQLLGAFKIALELDINQKTGFEDSLSFAIVRILTVLYKF